MVRDKEATCNGGLPFELCNTMKQATELLVNQAQELRTANDVFNTHPMYSQLHRQSPLETNNVFAPEDSILGIKLNACPKLEL